MTNEERDIISRFVARVGGAAPGGFGGSVPGTQQAPALPPMDAEADRFIADQFAQHPEARYRITQMAFVQEAALVEAQNRIRRLEWEVQQRQAAAPAQGQQQPSRGFFGTLFGGGGQPQGQPQGQPSYGQPQYGQPQAQYQQQPPPAQYPPGYQPGMLQRGGGSGFLGSALTTAAGVAGGMVAGNALMGLFSGHQGGGGFGGGGQTVNETVNNYGDAGAQPDPWGGAGVADPNAGGFAQPDQGGAMDGGGAFDQGTADPGFDQGGGFGGGLDDNSGGGGGDTWT